MRLLLLVFLTTTLSFGYAAHSFPAKDSGRIAVLLQKDASEALLEVKGPYTIFNPKDGSKITSGLLGKRFLVHSAANGLKWGEEFLGIYQIYLLPKSEKDSVLVNGIQYEGAIAIFLIDGKINIVNDLGIEKYVKSTLTSQFTYPLENEVMSAIAILARTDAYFHVEKNKSSIWHVDAKENGYFGSALKTPDSFIEKVVDSTKDLILAHSNHGRNLPFPATWTEHSAGKTASFSAIFRKDHPFMDHGVEASHAKLDKTDSRWQFSLSKKELANLFSLPEIRAVELFVDKESKRAYAVRITGPDYHEDLSFFDFQKKLGKERLKSNDFAISVKDQRVLFSGFGKGHGVGLCIYSASAMAQNGENALKILSKFYPETFLLNLSAIPGSRSVK